MRFPLDDPSRAAPVVDLGDGWTLLGTPHGIPYLDSPGGERRELQYGALPLPGWERRVETWLAGSREADPALSAAAKKALQRWRWTGPPP